MLFQLQKELLTEIYWRDYYGIETRFPKDFYDKLKDTSKFEDQRQIIADKFCGGDIVKASHWILEFLFFETPNNRIKKL